MPGEHSAEQVAALKKAFDVVDTKGSGSIERRDVKRALGGLHLSLSSAEVEQMVGGVGLDRHGRVSFAAFCKMMEGRLGKVTEEAEADRKEEMTAAFRQLDQDGNGKITREELTRVMADLGGQRFSDKDVEEMIAQADIDEDGKINYEEFVKMVCSQ